MVKPSDGFSVPLCREQFLGGLAVCNANAILWRCQSNAEQNYIDASAGPMSGMLSRSARIGRHGTSRKARRQRAGIYALGAVTCSLQKFRSGVNGIRKSRLWPNFGGGVLKIRVFLSVTPALFFIAAAHAQQLPNEADFKAAYCVGVLQKALVGVSQVELNSSSTPEAAFADAAGKFHTHLRRVQLYLLSRIPYLDMRGIEAARSRGDEDESNAVRYAERCITNCTDAVCAHSCADKNESITRIRICNDLSFLPY
jgi:hypothetical protein